MSDALCSCGACIELAGKSVYAPVGGPLVWKPRFYCPDCGDAVGEPGSHAALQADAGRYAALRRLYQDQGKLTIFEGHPPCNVVIASGAFNSETSTGADFDAAVDAAIAAQGGADGE